MATVSVAFDGTRMSEAESITDGGNWYLWGTTSKPSVEVDFVYQLGSSSAAISRKVSAATGGVEFNATTAVDYTSATAVRAVLALVNVTTYGLIDTTVHKGADYNIGSSPTAYYGYYLYGSFNSYPPKGGWQIVMIDPNEVEYRDATTGTPVLTTVDYYGWWADITGSVKAENIVHDAICYLAKEQGLTLTRGDSTDPDGVWQDFVDFDEGTVGNRYGVVVTSEGVLNVTGWLTIGDSSGTNATVFYDTGKVIVFREQLVSAGFSGLKVYQGNASDDVDIVDTFIQSKGRGFAKDLFDTSADIDATNDVITLAWDHWRDLDYFTYSKEGGTDTTGLTDANEYWVLWDSTNSGWAFYSSRANAAADTSRINLSAGTGESHSFSKVNDTRADLTISGTSGLGADITGCTIDNLRNITLTSAGTLERCKITNCEQITQASGFITDCTISLATTDDGEAFIVSNGSLANISGNDFTHSDGHAIEITATGTYNFNGNTFSGYSGTPGSNGTPSSGSTDAMIYNNSGGLVTLNIGSGGDTPSIRNGASATTVVNNNVTLTFDKLKDNTEVRIYAAGTSTELDGIENATAGSPDNRNFPASIAASTSVDYWILALGYVVIKVKAFTWPTTTQTINIQQIIDRNYENP